MRIAYVCADSGVPAFGHKGCSVHVREMIRAFRKRALQIDLFAAALNGRATAHAASAAHRGTAPPAGFSGVRLHQLPQVPLPGGRHDEGWVEETNAALRSALEAQGPFDLIYERYSLWSYAGMEFARGRGIPRVLEVNAPLIEEQERYRQLDRPDLAQEVATRVFESAAVLCAVSSQVADYLRGFPEARGRIHVVPNGVDPSRFAVGVHASACAGDPLKRELQRPSRPFTVGFVGSLKPWHGVSVLVEAFARLRRGRAGCVRGGRVSSGCVRGSRDDVRLLIVGDGPQREILAAQIAAEGRDVAAVTKFVGAVSPDEVPAFLAEMDAAAAPYPSLPDFFFSPLKVFEYMAAGLPVVASRLGDLPGIIRHGVNGLLSSPGDPVELAELLESLRQKPDLRRRLGEAARAAVVRRHTWDAVADRILCLAQLRVES